MTKPLSFNQIRHYAPVHGIQITDLVAVLETQLSKDPHAFVDPEDLSEYKKLASMLMGIHAVLELISRTPNASVNREALDAMEEKIREAESLLADEWVKDTLKDAGKVLGRPAVGYMPF